MKSEALNLVPIAYDGGLCVSMNRIVFPKSGKGMLSKDILRYRYRVQRTAQKRWRIFDDTGEFFMSKKYDAFLQSSPPDNTAKFIADTTWSTAQSAMRFLKTWRIRERKRCAVRGFRKFGKKMENK